MRAPFAQFSRRRFGLLFSATTALSNAGSVHKCCQPSAIGAHPSARPAARITTPAKPQPPRPCSTATAAATRSAPAPASGMRTHGHGQGLCGFEFPNPRVARLCARPQGAVWRTGRRLLLGPLGLYQLPERAVYGGLISLWGTLNATDGGDTTCFSLSGLENAQLLFDAEGTLDPAAPHGNFLSEAPRAFIVLKGGGGAPWRACSPPRRGWQRAGRGIHQGRGVVRGRLFPAIRFDRVLKCVHGGVA